MQLPSPRPLACVGSMTGLAVGLPLLLILTLGVLVLASRPRRVDHQAFFAHSALTVAYMVMSIWAFLVTPADMEGVERAVRAVGILWLTSTALFAWTFPTGRQPPRGPLAVALVACGLCVGLSFWAPFELGLLVGRIYFAGSALAIFLWMWTATDRVRVPTRRRGVALVQAVMFLRLLLVVVIFALRRLNGGPPPLALVVLEVFIAPPVTVCVLAWALLRYQLFDVRYFITRSLGVFVVAALSGVLLIVAMEGVQRGLVDLGLGTLRDGHLVAPGLMLLLVIAVNPLRRRLESWLEAVLNRDLVRAREALEGYFSRTGGVLDRERLLSELATTAAVIVPEGVVAVVELRPSPRLLPGPGFRSGGEAEWTQGEALALSLRRLHLPVWTREREELPGLDPAPLRELGVDIAIPFEVKGELSGLLLVQAPAWERERVELLVELARHLGLQLANAALYGEALSAGEALRAANQVLEARGRALSAANRSLHEANEQLKKMAALERELEGNRRLAALGQLAAAMAHEIRTPLTSIQLNVQILAGKIELPPEDSEYFDIVQTELGRLNRVVGEVLDFARPMVLNKVEIDLRELGEEVVRGMYFLLAERGCEVQVEGEGEGPWTLRIEPERIKQVLINLLDNASQALRPEGERQITLALRRKDVGEEGELRPGIELAVIDQGCGMSDEVRARVFEPFFTTRPSGTGLGLAICEKICKAHGGSLQVESTLGVGTTFRLWLPA